ncbi:T9SS type A sorting domain-containing protein [candidate division KSB1 bacterium]|nr:T9SS type A sorting domain-containing protein [candidate division KSB1 bacterium]NIR70459.1 T9SS type A sorting domain-containing protein [candidate division KSB1 bacterium]NIS23189.1 T9SS type A sorting domain-containing protein [candidate division KSB1 bacterium]NIT70049.1 T9SS type A sorting domain-containing protein [candidate division KSB1 bacterium]NIU23686.1 T9SS type A sorting domain-containing protein [candidate division KSB1 bacterium]
MTNKTTYFFAAIFLYSHILAAQNADDSGLQTQFTFVDISANVDTLTSIEGGVAGSAWGDFNNDGYQDLYLATKGLNLLYRNNSDGTFTDVTNASGMQDTSKSKAGTWGDFNNDGLLDLYVSNNAGHPNRLYRNDGGGNFTDIAVSAGVNDSSFAQGVAWADYDADSDLDFCLIQDDIEDRLFRNDGNGIFTDVAPSFGMDSPWAAYGISWLDFNNDNHLDLYVTNCETRVGDFWTNLLYRNNGDGSFTNVSSDTGLDYFGASQGAFAFDFGNDFDIDILVVNSDGGDSFLLYENSDGAFTEISAQAGLVNVGVLFSVTSGDYDNDGDLDLLVGGLQNASRLFQNQGDGRFEDVSEQIELPMPDDPLFSSVTSADINNDGFLDLLMADERSRAFLFRNQPPNSIAGNHWLIVKLKGVQNNSFGIGAKITAIAQDLRQFRYVVAGSGLYSENMLPVHFGFANRNVVDSLIVLWPNNLADTLYNVAVNQIIEIEEGGLLTDVPDVEVADTPKSFELAQNYPNPFNASTTIQYRLSENALVSLSIYNLIGERIRQYRIGTRTPGDHTLSWNGKTDDGREMPSGIYFYKLTVGQLAQTRKMILSR